MPHSASNRNRNSGAKVMNKYRPQKSIASVFGSAKKNEPTEEDFLSVAKSAKKAKPNNT